MNYTGLIKLLHNIKKSVKKNEIMVTYFGNHNLTTKLIIIMNIVLWSYLPTELVRVIVDEYGGSIKYRRGVWINNIPRMLSETINHLLSGRNKPNIYSTFTHIVTIVRLPKLTLVWSLSPEYIILRCMRATIDDEHKEIILDSFRF